MVIVRQTAYILSGNNDLKDKLEKILRAKAAGGFDVQRVRSRDDLLGRLTSCQAVKSVNNIVFLDAILAANFPETVHDTVRAIKIGAAGIPVVLLNTASDMISIGVDNSIPYASVSGEAKLGSEVQACLANLKHWRDNFAAGYAPGVVTAYRGRMLLSKELHSLWEGNAFQLKRFRNVIPGTATLVTQQGVEDVNVIFKRTQRADASRPEASNYTLLHNLQGRLIPQRYGNDEHLLALEQIGELSSFGANSLDDRLVRGEDDKQQFEYDLMYLVDAAARMFYASTLALLEDARPRDVPAERPLMGTNTRERWADLCARFAQTTQQPEPFVYGVCEYHFITAARLEEKLLRDFRRVTQDVRKNESEELVQQLSTLLHERSNGEHFLKWVEYCAPGFVHLDFTTNNILSTGQTESDLWRIIDLYHMGVGSPLFHLAFLAHPSFVLPGKDESAESQRARRESLIGNFAQSIKDAQKENPIHSMPKAGIPDGTRLSALFPSYGVWENLRMMGDIVGEKGYAQHYGQEYRRDLVRHAQAASILCESELVSTAPAIRTVAEFIKKEVLDHITRGA